MTRPVMSVATIINHKGWAFDGVHNSYTVALVVWRSPCSPASTPASGPSTESTDATRSALSPPDAPTPAKTPGGVFDTDPDITAEQQPCVAIYPGPAQSQEHFDAVKNDGPEHVELATFRKWSHTAAFPQIPTRAAFKVWCKIKAHPRFDEAPPPPENQTAGDGGSGQCRGTSTPARTGIDSSETMDVPPSPRARRHQGPASVPPRRWKFRPVAELHATHDRHRFMNDDGAVASTTSTDLNPAEVSESPPVAQKCASIQRRTSP